MQILIYIDHKLAVYFDLYLQGRIEAHLSDFNKPDEIKFISQLKLRK